jgi:hypothetical protein
MLVETAFSAALQLSTFGDKVGGGSTSTNSPSTGNGGNCRNVDTAVPPGVNGIGVMPTQRWNLTLESLSGTTHFPVQYLINGPQGAPVDPLMTSDPNCPILGYVLTDVQHDSVKLINTGFTLNSQPILQISNSVAADLIAKDKQLTFALRGIT